MENEKHVEHLVGHLKKAAETHEELSAQHHELAKLHRDHANSLTADKAASAVGFHNECADRHAALGKCHARHGEDCEKAAVEIGEGMSESEKAARAAEFQKSFFA